MQILTSRKQLKLHLLITASLLIMSCGKREDTQPIVIDDIGVNPAESIIAPTYIEKDRKDIIKLKSSPSSLNFGEITQETQIIRSVGITNVFNKPITFKTVKVYGAENLYKVSSDCKTGKTLQPDESCKLTVTYLPLDQSEHEGEILISYESGQPLTIKLKGQGTLPEEKPIDQAYIDAINYAKIRQKSGIKIHQSELQILSSTSLINSKLNEYPNALYKSNGKTVSSLPVDRSRIITQDRYIPAVLENTINSEIPGGRIVAVVERNVYGSDARKVLIPAGSRVIGNYGKLRGIGSERLAVNWNRILRPDGVSISLSAEGADPMGRLGLIGDVDTRFFQKYGSAILTSILGIMPEYFFGEGGGGIAGNIGEGGIVISSGENNLSSKASATQQFSKDMSTLAQRIIQENIQITPIITIPQGTRILIIPAQDIYLIRPDQFIRTAESGNYQANLSTNQSLKIQSTQSNSLNKFNDINQQPQVHNTITPSTGSPAPSRRLYNPSQMAQ